MKKCLSLFVFLPSILICIPHKYTMFCLVAIQDIQAEITENEPICKNSFHPDTSTPCRASLLEYSFFP